MIGKAGGQQSKIETALICLLVGLLLVGIGLALFFMFGIGLAFAGASLAWLVIVANGLMIFSGSVTFVVGLFLLLSSAGRSAPTNRKSLLELTGKLEWDQSFDYKEERGRD